MKQEIKTIKECYDGDVVLIIGVVLGQLFIWTFIILGIVGGIHIVKKVINAVLNFI